jgi:hypothetical protein
MTTTTTQFTYSHNRLQTFLDEKENWDGCGGLPASPDAGKGVLAFLANIEAAQFEEPSLTMGGDGSIAVTWQCQQTGHYLSADFCDDQGYTFFVAEGEKFICDGYSTNSEVAPRLALYLQMGKADK